MSELRADLIRKDTNGSVVSASYFEAVNGTLRDFFTEPLEYGGGTLDDLMARIIFVVAAPLLYITACFAALVNEVVKALSNNVSKNPADGDNLDKRIVPQKRIEPSQPNSIDQNPAGKPS